MSTSENIKHNKNFWSAPLPVPQATARLVAADRSLGNKATLSASIQAGDGCRSCISSLSKIFSAAWHWCPSVSTGQSLMHGDSCRVLITLEGFAVAMTSLEVAAGSFTSIRGPWYDRPTSPAPGGKINEHFCAF